MSIEELEERLVSLPEEQFQELLDRLATRRGISDDQIDSTVLNGGRPRLADMKSGAAAPVPFDVLLHELKTAAGQIPEDDRAELVDRLIGTLSADEQYDPAWVAEMNRRMDEIESGQAKTLSEKEFFAGLTARRHARSLSR